MTSKQLPEEKELRKHVGPPIDSDASVNDRVEDARRAGRLITALVKAVRADEREKCAKKCDAAARYFATFAERAKKKGHNVDDIVARRIACEDLAAAIRSREGRKSG